MHVYVGRALKVHLRRDHLFKRWYANENRLFYSSFFFFFFRLVFLNILNEIFGIGISSDFPESIICYALIIQSAIQQYITERYRNGWLCERV